MELVYLSWLRGRIGIAKETVDLPGDGLTARNLVDWLARQDTKYQVLASETGVINLSVNGQVVADWNEYLICQGDNIVFFPPMAGG